LENDIDNPQYPALSKLCLNTFIDSPLLRSKIFSPVDPKKNEKT